MGHFNHFALPRGHENVRRIIPPFIESSLSPQRMLTIPKIIQIKPIHFMTLELFYLCLTLFIMLLCSFFLETLPFSPSKRPFEA
jgi:hypothetical protein